MKRKRANISESDAGSMATVAESRERTSAEIASLAGHILGSPQVLDAVEWLEEVIASCEVKHDVRAHAVVLVGAITQARRVAASALTQR